VNVVGHQAIGPDLDRGQNVAIERIVGRFDGNLLAAIAALGHVMRKLKWSRLSEQIFRIDKWGVCRG
jgi:hypothetical protein